MSFQLQKGVDLYRLVAPDGTEGDAVEYGYPASVEYDGKLHVVYCDDPTDEDPDLILDGKLLVECGTPVAVDANVEFVEEDDEDDAGVFIQEDDEDDDLGPEDGDDPDAA